MKKITLILALIVAPMVSYGQSIFDTLEDMDDVSSVIVNKDAFEILSKFNVKSDDKNEAMEIFTMIQNLEELKMFSTNDATIATKMDGMVKTHIRKANLTQLMRVKDKGSRVKIYVKASKNKNLVSEVLMFVQGIDKHSKGKVSSVVVSLTGDIDINKLSKLADTITKEHKKDKK